MNTDKLNLSMDKLLVRETQDFDSPNSFSKALMVWSIGIHHTIKGTEVAYKQNVHHRHGRLGHRERKRDEAPPVLLSIEM